MHDILAAVYTRIPPKHNGPLHQKEVAKKKIECVVAYWVLYQISMHNFPVKL